MRGAGLAVGLSIAGMRVSRIMSPNSRLGLRYRNPPFAPRRGARPDDGSVGFTLMELIIVMSIIAILSASVLPVFGGTMSRLQRDHAVRDLVATFRYAQERAVTDTREYRLVLDKENGEYWLMRFAEMDGRKKIFKAVDERQGKSMFLPERLTMDKIKARKDRKEKYSFIAFYPNGACDEASVTLQNEDGRSVTIETKGSLGQLEVKTPRGSERR